MNKALILLLLTQAAGCARHRHPQVPKACSTAAECEHVYQEALAAYNTCLDERDNEYCNEDRQLMVDTYRQAGETKATERRIAHEQYQAERAIREAEQEKEWQAEQAKREAEREQLSLQYKAERKAEREALKAQAEALAEEERRRLAEEERELQREKASRSGQF